MNKQTKTLEKTCKKLEANLLRLGASEKHTNLTLCLFLQAWIDTQTDAGNVFFGESLLRGYEEELK